LCVQPSVEDSISICMVCLVLKAMFSCAKLFKVEEFFSLGVGMIKELEKLVEKIKQKLVGN